MILKSMVLRNFRNYKEQQINWHSKINIIYGKNAQGKTNLLEAIAYLSLGKSFREQTEEKMKMWNNDFFFLGAEIEKNGKEHSLSAGYNNRKKFWKKDNNHCKNISEIIGFLHTVVFTPEDLELVKKGPEVRRFFLDREMVQMFGGYHLYLNNYKKALLQRNNLLKQMQYNSSLTDDMLAIWEDQLAENGAFIIMKRYQILEKLNVIAKEIHSILSDGGEDLKLVYDCGGGKIDFSSLSTLGDLRKQLLLNFEAKREDDKRRGVTTIGPHRDDFKIFINDIDARNFGSQGQQRTAALAIKLSEVELVYEIAGYYPLLLLDDVLSELDYYRRKALISMMLNKAQIFISTTDINNELANIDKKDYEKFEIEGGKIL